jgi:hypothetical protein
VSTIVDNVAESWFSGQLAPVLLFLVAASVASLRNN